MKLGLELTQYELIEARIKRRTLEKSLKPQELHKFI